MVARLLTLCKDTLADARSGVAAWRIWGKFAWYDLLARYRHSWLGPFWLTISAAVFIATLSLVYGTLFRQPIRDYVPFVALGIACWSFVSSVASEGVSTFVESESYLRQVRASPLIYVLRVLWRNILVFLHQFAVALLVVVLAGKLRLDFLPIAAFGLLLLFLQALWVIPLLGFIGTRYRDLQPITTNILQVLVFITPIVWFPSALGSRRWIADVNPLTSLIAVLRDPLLGEVPSLGAYAFVGVITVIGLVTAVLFYGRYRSRLIYWL